MDLELTGKKYIKKVKGNISKNQWITEGLNFN